jgi:hypothetical protein
VQIYDGSTTAATNFNTQLLTGLTTGICFVSRTATGNAVAIPFSISGTTITVGTSSATFGYTTTGFTAGGRVIQGATAMSSTVMLISYTSVALSTFVVNTITYNGASAPTLGTATATITYTAGANYNEYGPAHLAYLTSTTAQLWYWSTSENVATRIITTNGILAPTLGTVLNTALAVSKDQGQNVDQIFVNSATETAIRFLAPYNSKSSTLFSFAISGTTVTLQNKTTTTLLTSSVPVAISGGAGLYISNNSTADTNSNLINASNTGIYKYNFVSGSNVFSYSSSTPAFSTYAGLQSVAVLSATTGIVVGYSSAFMPYANAININ